MLVKLWLLCFAVGLADESSQAENFSYVDLTDCTADSAVTIVSNSDRAFCGILFRQIKNPTELANWRAIEARPTDVWYATLPPSGNAKGPVSGLVNNLVDNIRQISGHTEFLDWENDPTGSSQNFLDDSTARMIGTHVSFEALPTSVINTPDGQEPCKVIFVVREPKENMVAAALFSGDESDIGPHLQKHVDAATGENEGELGTPNRGFAAYANGYAAALGGEVEGGPKVFLLSQMRLADENTVADEVARLAAFLGVETYGEDVVTRANQDALASMGDWTQLTSEQAALVDDTFASPTVDPRITELYHDVGIQPQTSSGSNSGSDGGSGNDWSGNTDQSAIDYGTICASSGLSCGDECEAAARRVTARYCNGNGYCSTSVPTDCPAVEATDAPEPVCEEGEMDNSDPCEPKECVDNDWVSIIVDCAEQMGMECLAGWMPAVEGTCCSTCPCDDIMCTMQVCDDGSNPPVPEGECCGDMSLCPTEAPEPTDPVYLMPDEGLLDSMMRVLQRDYTVARLRSAGQRAAALLQEKDEDNNKVAPLYDPVVKQSLQKIRRFFKADESTYSEEIYNKQRNQYNNIAEATGREVQTWE